MGTRGQHHSTEGVLGFGIQTSNLPRLSRPPLATTGYDDYDALMNLFYQTPRSSFHWLLVLVVAAFWTSTSDAGLSIGLDDSDELHVVSGMSLSAPASSDEHEKAIVQGSDDTMETGVSSQSSNGDQVAGSNKWTGLSPVSNLSKWKRSRVLALYVHPPPFSVPIEGC